MPRFVSAQVAPKPRLIAFSSGNDEARLALFHAGMRDVGYVEGRDFTLAFFESGGPAIEQEVWRIINFAPDMIVGGNANSTRAFARLAPGIPIVSTSLSEEAALDVVGPDFGRPRGNVTGVVVRGFTTQGEPHAKVFETTRELKPTARVIGGIVSPGNESSVRTGGNVVVDRYGFRLALEVHRTTNDAAPEAKSAELDRIFTAFALQGVGVAANFTLLFDGAEIARRSAARRIPILHNRVEYAEEGGFIAYGYDLRYGFGRAAYFVDHLLRGAKVADLPLEWITEPRLAVNLTAAREQGFEVPPLLIARADVVIE